jgi:hypothetical protein
LAAGAGGGGNSIIAVQEGPTIETGDDEIHTCDAAHIKKPLKFEFERRGNSTRKARAQLPAQTREPKYIKN